MLLTISLPRARPRLLSRRVATASVLVATLTLASCSQHGSATPQPAPSVSLTASPAAVASGSGAVLTWSAAGATTCTATGGWTGAQAVSGTFSTGVLDTTTKYSLACTGPGGDGSASVTVTVSAPPPVVTLSASPTTVVAGDAATLTWSATDATTCAASGGWSGAEKTSGTASTGPLTTNTGYTLTCTGPGGSHGQSVDVSVTAAPPPPTVTFTASPTAIASGATTTLSWSATNASSCAASGGWSGMQLTSGSATTAALGSTTSFTLNCTGPGGSHAVTVTVTVVPAPTVAIAAKPASVVSGASAMLTWSSTNATACAASGGWLGAEPVSGTASTGAITATTQFVLTCTGVGGSGNGSASVVLANGNAFLVTPRNAALTLSQTQQFTASVPGGGAATWTVDGIPGGNATVGTISATGLYTPPAAAGTHSVVATSVANPAQAGTSAVAVTDLPGVFTYHNDQARTGQNLQEYALTPASVSGGTFGKQWSCAVDGAVYAQPLYVANLAIGGGTHNVIIVATQHDSVYAFDADSPSCVVYWQTSFLGPGVTSIPASDNGCGDVTLEYGITGTPVIDPSNDTLYVVPQTKESGNWFQRLHALDITTGAERAGSPVVIAATSPINGGGQTTFAALMQNQRPGLAVSNGGVYIAWASHCDNGPYNGWMMRYDETSLAQTAVLNVTPNGSEGGIWMSGGAPAFDSTGSIFVSTGNGTFDDTSSIVPPLAPGNDFGESFLKLNPTTLAVQDFYTPSQELVWSDDDLDISSAGVTVLPDGMGPASHPNVLVGSDKQGHLWMIDRTSMSRFSSTSDNTVEYLTLPYAATCAADDDEQCVYATPSYWNGTVYLAIEHGPVMAMALSNGLIPSAANVVTPTSQSSETYSFPTPTVSISASPAGNALVWALDNNANGTDNGSASLGPAVLRAYDATNLATTLYTSSALAADSGGPAVKFTVPVVANGHVYVPGNGQLTVYGLSP